MAPASLKAVASKAVAAKPAAHKPATHKPAPPKPAAPKPGPARQLKPLEKALGHSFVDRGLLRLALTPASMRTDGGLVHDNERLEFLGDRVLGLAIAEILTFAFPTANEGELARRFNRLVRRETCAEVGLALNLGHHIVLSGGEADSGGRSKATILADTCEAVLGAIFIDGGFEPARTAVERLWLGHLGTQQRDRPDAKSALQEWAQGQGMAIPAYAMTSRTGPDHAPQFTAEVRIPGRNPAVGEGSSKRLAEQAAATAFLLREQVWQESGDDDT